VRGTPWFPRAWFFTTEGGPRWWGGGVARWLRSTLCALPLRPLWRIAAGVLMAVMWGGVLPPPAGVWGMPPDILATIPGNGPDVTHNRAETRAIMARLG
jgi:hypothetical protein